MISFVMELLEDQSSLNSLLGKFGPRFSEQSVCVVVEKNQLYLIYGQTPDGTIAEFAPKECVIWLSDSNRLGYTTWQMLDKKAQIMRLLDRAAIHQYNHSDKDIAFDIICRLIETIQQPKRKERLTSDDLDKGLVDLGRKPPSLKWVINYVTQGLTFRSKAESGSTGTLEDYISDVLDMGSKIQELADLLSDPTKIMNAN